MSSHDPLGAARGRERVGMGPAWDLGDPNDPALKGLSGRTAPAIYLDYWGFQEFK